MADDHEDTSSEGEVVESLIQGRERRSTAGRHMSALLDAEADDELALLFEEVDDDNDFSGAEAEAGEEDDVGLESSDEDEDQGPNAREDDYEGEKEVEKQAKVDRQKRRAQEDLRLKIARKRVKIDPTAVSAAPAPRPKKKSERISWLPTVEDGPTRSSSRRQTMVNKELTHARLKDSEEKRIRLIATMEEAAKRKAHLKPKEMTQAERLAEAERVEKFNSKSLNRWEEMEKRKAEERRAKIEALQNRRLEGPVISYWSGVATWVDGRLTRVGKVDITPKPDKEENTRKKGKKMDKEEKNATEQPPAELAAAGPATSSENPTAPVRSGEGESVKQNNIPPTTEQTSPGSIQEKIATSDNTNTNAPLENSTTSPAPPPTTTTETSKVVPPTESSTSAPNDESGPEKVPDSGSSELENETSKEPLESKTTDEVPKDDNVVEMDIDEKPAEASKDPNPQDTQATSQVPGETHAPKLEKPEPETLPLEAKPDDAPKEPIPEPSTTGKAASETSVAPQVASPLPTTPVPAAAVAPAGQQGETQPPAASEIHVDQATVTIESTPHPEIPSLPPVIEQTGRFLTVLENFDDKTAQSREFSIYFNAKKPARLTKISSSLCVITSLPSRYRDPDTSLPFANAYACREIQRTVAQNSAWSPMLGCYVGPVGIAARGVPERFLGGAQAGTEAKESSRNNEPTAAEKDKEGETNTSGGTSSTPTPAPSATPAPVTAGGGDAMDIDK